jgi:branched-chain amino acid transport system substrate-binding protein
MAARTFPCPAKVIVIVTIAMTFFLVSCGKGVVLKEIPEKVPPGEKPPEGRAAPGETPEAISIGAITPKEITPLAEIPPEEFAAVEKLPPEKPPEEKPSLERPPAPKEAEEIVPEEITAEEMPPEEMWPEKEAVIDRFFIAENYFRQQEYDMALEAYDQYLMEFPLGDKVKDALARMGTIYYRKNQYHEALALLQEALDQFPLNRTRADIHLLIAKAYFHLGKFAESRKTALRWLELYKDYPKKEEIFFLLGQTAMEFKDYPKTFYWWVKVLEVPSIADTRKEEVRSHMLDLISQASEAELEEMAKYAEGTDLIVAIYSRLALSLLQSGRLEEARKAAEEILRLAPGEEWNIMAEEMLQEIDERLLVNLHVIGCLLPLSGPFAIYGQEVLRGLELGLDLFQESSEDLSSVELAIRDTGGDPNSAIEGLRELKRDEKVMAVVGPLISKVADVVAEEGQESGIPIITLSQSETITDRGEMVFQNNLAAEDQLRSLTNKVMDEMGLKRFAILYPANPYGMYFMNKFWDKVESKGGLVNAVESYDPQGTDFATEIKKMVGLFYPRPSPDTEGEVQDLGVVKERQEEELEPIIDFDAVFIPDSYQRVALIISQLAYHDVVDVTLLGTDLWNSQELIEIAGRYVRGAIFPSGFFPGSGYRGVERFVEEYKSSFGHEPGLLAALGYDTVRIVRAILKEKGRGIRTRSDFRSALAGNDTFESVTGPMFFDEQRRAKRDPLLLTISGGHFLLMP